MERLTYFVYNNTNPISDYINRWSLTADGLVTFKRNNPTWLFELVERPHPPVHIKAGLAGHDPYEIDYTVHKAIKSVAQLPHIWGGGYDPTQQTMHGEPIFDFIEEIPVEFSATTDYVITNKVLYDSKTFIAIVDTVAASVVTPDTLPLVWKDITSHITADKSVYIMKDGLKSSIHVQSTALIPDATVVQFTANFKNSEKFSVALGIAVDKPDLTKGLTNFNKGLVLEIKNDKQYQVTVAVKKADGTDADFDTSSVWTKFNGAYGAGSELDVFTTYTNGSDEHTFQIESSKGRIRVKINHIKFGEFTFPDETYPFRKHVTGDTTGHIQDHYEEDYYVLRGLTGTNFSISELAFNRVNLSQISDNFVVDFDHKVRNNEVSTGRISGITYIGRRGYSHSLGRRPAAYGANLICKADQGGYKKGQSIKFSDMVRSNGVAYLSADDDLLIMNIFTPSFSYKDRYTGSYIRSSLLDWDVEVWWI